MMNANLIADELTAFALPTETLTRNAGLSGPAGMVTLGEPSGCVSHGGLIRFEPITVRAAARVLRLQRTGIVSEREAAFYVSELAAMDSYAGRESAAKLYRLARRKSRCR